MYLRRKLLAFGGGNKLHSARSTGAQEAGSLGIASTPVDPVLAETLCRPRRPSHASAMIRQKTQSFCVIPVSRPRYLHSWNARSVPVLALSVLRLHRVGHSPI